MNFRKLILFSTGLALFPSFTKAQLKKISSGVYELNAGHMSLQVDAERGARIVSLRLAGKETLSTVKIHPENYGSTLWLSPQQNWGWPPYVVLDVKPYRVVANTKNSITLQSSPDSVSGCSMSKVITANCNDTSFSIVYTITNISSKEKKLAPWR